MCVFRCVLSVQEVCRAATLSKQGRLVGILDAGQTLQEAHNPTKWTTDQGILCKSQIYSRFRLLYCSEDVYNDKPGGKGWGCEAYQYPYGRTGAIWGRGFLDIAAN